MPQSITDRLVRSAKPRTSPYDIRDTGRKGFILRVRPNGRKAYYIEYGRGKRKLIGSAGELTLTQARIEFDRLKVEANDGRLQPKATPVSLGKFVDSQYQEWALVELKTGQAIVARLRSCFAGFWEMNLDELTQWHIEKWRSERLRSGRRASTVNRDITALKSALNKAVSWGLIAENPIRNLKPKKVDSAPKIRYLDADEERRLREALDARERRECERRASGNRWREARGRELMPPREVDYLKVMVLVSMNTGLRQGELLGLSWENVDLDRRTLTVEGWGAKSGKTLHVPINAEALSELQRWQKAQGSTGAVFKGAGGAALTHTKRSWAAVLKEAGIENFRWHDLRHHFASWLVMSGVDLNTVRELLGHSDIKTTLRYAHLAPEHVRAAVEKLDRNLRDFEPIAEGG